MGWWIIFLGAAAGSAANALIDRLPKEESWIKGRSKCDKCGHALGWRDLIPVLSYLSLRGKCRYCRAPIPFRNLVVEIVIALGFFMIYFFHLPVLFYPILIMTVIITVMDWETQLVSELIVAVWGGLVVLSDLGNITNPSRWTGLVMAVVLIGGIWLATRARAMGFGDIEIAAVLGWWLGWPKIVAGLWAAFVIGAAAAGILLILRKVKIKSTIAFGPFLVIGGWMGKLFGDIMINFFRYGYV